MTDVRDGGEPRATEEVALGARAHDALGARAHDADRCARAASAARDGLWEWELASGELWGTGRAWDLLGLAAPADGVGRIDDLWGRVHVEDVAGLRRALDAHLGGGPGPVEHDVRVAGPGGGPTWISVRAVATPDGAGSPRVVSGSVTDVHDRVVAERLLLRQALLDPLTGRASRLAFRERLDRAVAQAARRRGFGFGVVVVDVDRFAWVNESLGTSVGDDLLRQVADRLASTTRPGDTVGRLGADEFAVLLEPVRGVDEALVAARRVAEALARPYALGGQEVVVDCSVGVTTSEESSSETDVVLRDASSALHEAKLLGGGQVVVHRREGPPAPDRLELEQDLRRAVETGTGLVVHYQPIVSVPGRRLLGFEALVRWAHPHRGLLQPAEFLDVADQTGLVVPLGERVLEAALGQVRDWGTAGIVGLSVSVNVSARQLDDGRLVDTVAQALRSSGVEPHRLWLEITEHVVLGAGDAEDQLADLRGMGVRIFSDDFGAGYAGLSYLSRFPVDAVKIDRSFIAGIDRRPGDVAIVEAIVALGRSLDLLVVAEGVETEEQLAAVSRLGCDSAQGFLFSGPISPGDVVDLAELEERLSGV